MNEESREGRLVPAEEHSGFRLSNIKRFPKKYYQMDSKVDQHGNSILVPAADT